MPYNVSRSGQMYGPYTLEELQRYIATGNILPTDLARRDGMAEWLPVQQIVEAAGAGGGAGAVPPVYAPANLDAYPDPPNLSWGLVVLFTILTCGVFMIVWNIIVAAWIKRVQPNSQGLFFYIGGVVLLLLNTGTSFGMLFAFHHTHLYGHHPFAGLIGISAWVIRMVGLFMMKDSLEEHFNGAEPIGLRLSPGMTLFFGGLYLQYHLNRISEVKRSLRFQRVAR